MILRLVKIHCHLSKCNVMLFFPRYSLRVQGPPLESKILTPNTHKAGHLRQLFSFHVSKDCPGLNKFDESLHVTKCESVRISGCAKTAKINILKQKHTWVTLTFKFATPIFFYTSLF